MAGKAPTVDKTYRGPIVCSNCGAQRQADGKIYDGLDQHWVGGQHVCDRFEYGYFGRVVGRARSEETDGND